jgi:hypothetical protein
MEINSFFSTMAFALSTGAIAPYIYNIYKGTVQTTLSTWIAWTLMNTALLAGIISSGEMSWQVAAFIIGNLSVVLVSMFKGAKFAFTRLDLGCLALTVLAIIAWALSGNPTVALVMSVTGLFAGAIPMLKNMWENPHTEKVHPWVIFSVGSIFALLSVTQLNLATLLAPIFFLTLQLVFVALISRKFIR